MSEKQKGAQPLRAGRLLVNRFKRLDCYLRLPGLMVSTVVVLGRRIATFTGMNSPDFASRPILTGLLAIWSFSSGCEPKNCAFGIPTVLPSPLRQLSLTKGLEGRISAGSLGVSAD